MKTDESITNYMQNWKLKPSKSNFIIVNTFILCQQECLFDIGNCKSGLIAYNLTAILHENGSAYYNFAANMHEDRKIQAEEVPYVEPNVNVHERQKHR